MDQILLNQLKNAKIASRQMMNVETSTKNKALEKISQALIRRIPEIIEENQKDFIAAKENGMSEAMMDRLLLNEERITSIAEDVLKLTQLDDPVGDIIREIHRPNGLVIKQVRVPIGVFGIIYESRPNVTVDIACLCIKSSNVCVLKGGKEALHSNKILTSIMQEAISGILPDNSIQLIQNTDRSMVSQLITANDYVDVVVPRGGKGLIQHVVKNATVPVIETGAGNCHLYIDKDADLNKAINISVNAKIQRPSVCNAIETILVHKDIAKDYLPAMVKAFDGRVDIRGDKNVEEIISCQLATDEDYATEYDDYIVAIKIVNSLEEVIDHIYKYSTKHSESIITENQQTADIFMNALDSACVYHNASTRFSDGGEFGFGAELGISTQKLHARGPLALLEMTSFQYKIYGNGQIRE
ncbi:glutamate-5-semialdehyde dehydrogenase [Candidatus Stoquefichus massiliensis]|uniref:glutamate-5-semialdehyde dehydrogenase n=1 Tax=Candidatus Stoquefichus massiliensis TaxID=1470350 RepID=UPI00048175FF|nr:glutamate-5-semialdehyde dehydrogenase [Candidatus Stoquefichus massiliensis]